MIDGIRAEIDYRQERVRRDVDGVSKRRGASAKPAAGARRPEAAKTCDDQPVRRPQPVC
ncbi:hypothetical protein [Jiangella anatolica]|uniref:hypothetical protein n=1 Tax=Jiangella anatolica TaxID=2670374 RepID=UPI0013140E10|nr:hypothetical protein [Jiangella anatolica]